MDEHFTPQNAFEGMVATKLDNIEKRLDDLPCAESEQRLRKVESKVSNIEGKAAVIGGIMGICAAWIKSAIWK